MTEPDEGWVQGVCYAFADAGWLRWLPMEAHRVFQAVAEGSIAVGWGLEEEEELTEEDRPVVLERSGRLARHTGVTLRSVGDLVELMVQLHIFQRDGSRMTGVRVAEPMPVPEGTGVLCAEEVAEEDQLRWKSLVRPTAQVVVDALERRRTSTVVVSLEALAAESRLSVESVRAACCVLDWFSWEVEGAEVVEQEAELIFVWSPTDSLFETLLNWEDQPGGAVPVSISALAQAMHLDDEEVRRGLDKMHRRKELVVDCDVNSITRDEPLFVWLPEE